MAAMTDLANEAVAKGETAEIIVSFSKAKTRVEFKAHREAPRF